MADSQNQSTENPRKHAVTFDIMEYQLATDEPENAKGQ